VDTGSYIEMHLTAFGEVQHKMNGTQLGAQGNYNAMSGVSSLFLLSFHCPQLIPIAERARHRCNDSQTGVGPRCLIKGTDSPCKRLLQSDRNLERDLRS
jgi:hypothetical protein